MTTHNPSSHLTAAKGALDVRRTSYRGADNAISDTLRASPARPVLGNDGTYRVLLEDFVFRENFNSVLADDIGPELGVVCDASHLFDLDGSDDVALVNGRA